MTDSNYTHILAIVDRSGSMSSSARTMTSALNEYFKGQAAVPGKVLVDYVQFDTTYEKVYEDKFVTDAEAVIQPRGATALLDAIGRASVELGEKLASLPENKRPGKVQVVVVTDGYENASREWTPEKVKALVEQQEGQWNWDYVFLGANIDAVAVGGMYGFAADKSMTFNINDAAAVGATAQSLTAYTTAYRGGGEAKFSEEDRKKAVGDKS